MVPTDMWLWAEALRQTWALLYPQQIKSSVCILQMNDRNHRLTHFAAAIDRHGDCNINTASDFVAQYTTRQEYKYADAIPDYNQEWVKFRHLSTRSLKIFPYLTSNNSQMATARSQRIVPSKTLLKKRSY